MPTSPIQQTTCMCSRLSPSTFRTLSYQHANKRESWSRIPLLVDKTEPHNADASHRPSQLEKNRLQILSRYQLAIINIGSKHLELEHTDLLGTEGG